MRTALIGLCLFAAFSSFAQPGYKLQFKVDGLKDTTVYLGYYYGESTFVRDTARISAKGEFQFEGKQTLRQGVYFLVMDKTRIFEMVIGSDQHFSMTTKTSDYIKNMVVADDIDNKLFFENMTFNMERHKEAEPFIKVLQDSTLKEDQKKDARAAFTKVNDKVTAYQDDIISKHPATVTARI